MSIDVISHMAEHKNKASVDREAELRVELFFLSLKKALNRVYGNLGELIEDGLLRATKYNIALSVICSAIFSYIALSDDIKALVRRETIPFPVRDFVIGYVGVEHITFWVAITGFLIAAWLFCSSAISDIILKRQNRRLRAENFDLKSKNSGISIDCHELFSKYIYSIFRKYGYGSSERISLYVLDLEHFRCIGRHSSDEKYRELPKKMYPKEVGFIGAAWRKGDFSISELPDPSLRLSEWFDSNEANTNISREALQQIGMKSRAFHCVRIQNSKSTPVAIIVFESTNKKLPNEKTVNKDFGKYEARMIANLLDALKPHMVNLELAKREGF